MTSEFPTRWSALWVIALAAVIVVIDTTAVNVTLPTIQRDLGFDATSITWVVNAYLITFGGCLLVGGKLADIVGQRAMLLTGVVLFTVASLGCGLANSQGLLIVARAVQGVGGAVIVSVALSLIMALFASRSERARALGVYGFVCTGGGAAGLLLGGVLSSVLSWHWIFLINLPVGVAAYLLSIARIPPIPAPARAARLDLAGAVTLTGALALAVYVVISWNSPGAVALLVCDLALMAAFIVRQIRAHAPLIPRGFLSERNLLISNLVYILWAVGMSAWSVLYALYLQFTLGYGPLEVGLAFLPANILTAVLALWVSPGLITRFGVKKPVFVGLLLGAVGLLLMARTPADGGMTDVLPVMVCLGVNGGLTFNPLLLAAMSRVAPEQAGLASGVLNTSFRMGSALGLAVLAAVASAKGYGLAFLLGAGCFAGAALLGVIFLIQPAGRPTSRSPSRHEVQAS